MQQAVEKKGVAINPFAQVHYIDHLAPVCEIMNIPLLMSDELCLKTARIYYPSLNVQEMDFQDFQPENLIQNFDVLFYSDLWDQNTFREKFAPFEERYQKRMHSVHCPHGYSDKGFYLKKTADEELPLIYGQNMLDLFKAEKVWERLGSYVIIGNIRQAYYRKHQAFFDAITVKEILTKFPKRQPLILYAPTWKDLEESTSFFDAADILLESLPADYNIIVKLHPQLENDDTPSYYRLLGKFEKRSHILFVKDFPLIYPILSKTDIYIGDMSAIGYDFLAFNRPMFFLNHQKRDFNSDRRMFLTQCGVVVAPEDFKNIAKIIQKQMPIDKHYTMIRKEIDRYTFVPDRTFSEIKNDIRRVYNNI